MTIHIEVEEIDNGYTFSLFDSEGKSEDDVKMFVGDFDLALDAIKKWAIRVFRERLGENQK